MRHPSKFKIFNRGEHLSLPPNEDSPVFFLDFFDHLSDFNCDDIVIGGDYNLVMDLF